MVHGTSHRVLVLTCRAVADIEELTRVVRGPTVVRLSISSPVSIETCLTRKTCWRVEERLAGRGQNKHVIAYNTATNLVYYENRLGANRAVDTSAIFARLFRAVRGEREEPPTNAVFVLVNAPCNTGLERGIQEKDDLAGATDCDWDLAVPCSIPIDSQPLPCRADWTNCFCLMRDSCLNTRINA
ncbi:hypothetical protein PybrP1_002015 [[Pythium] brassicae (nom. inval.)]|nr:hypothetical protein PybrP1_002015 [[Pythium] brassicae (nom. inval.)]